MTGEFHSRRQFIKSGVVGGAGLTALSGCLGIGGGGGGGTTTLNLAFTVPVENVSSLMAIPEIQDEMDNLGSDYELNVNRNSATPDTLNQMAAGEVDLGLLSTVSYANAVKQEAVPGNITLVATDFWDAHPDNYGFTVYSLPDSGITEPGDLEGQTVATNATGTGTHAIFVKLFEELGLEAGSDVELVELAFPNMTPALNEGRIDAGMYPALFAPQARGADFNSVFSSHDVWDSEYPFAYITASNSSLDNKEDAISAWGDDYVNLLDYIYENRSNVVSLAADHFELSEDLVDQFFLTNQDYYREEPVTDVDRMQEMMDSLSDLGFFDESFNVEEYITNEYVQ